MINPTWLRSFCALVETGNFTRTAERLHMTQSGVSQHVRKLEEQLDVPLLSRHGKRFVLTEAGEKLYQEGRSIVAALTDLGDVVRQDPPWQGRVRIMSPGSVGLALYPRLQAVQQQHPQLVVDYRFAPNRDVEQKVAANDVDLGYMSCLPNHAEVEGVAVASEPLLLVTPARVGEVSWQQLQGLGFIDHPDGEHHAGLLLAQNYPEFRHLSQFNCRGFSNQIGMILGPVSRGLGFTVLPARAVGAFPEPDRIRVHTLACPVSETLYQVTHSRRVLPHRVCAVMRACQDVLQAFTQPSG